MFWKKTWSRTAIVMPLCGATVVFVWASARVCHAESSIDDQHKFAWAENIGWLNWRDADDGDAGVVVRDTFLSGFIWGENVGWLNVGDGSPEDDIHYSNTSGLDFGVNISTNGELFGFAWGENIGWVNFDTSSLGDDRAWFDACKHVFSGYVWAENVGWVHLGHTDYYVAVGPCVFGDYDCDGDVDLHDFAAFAWFLGGPDVAGDCSTFDSNSDGHIDLHDFSAFQAAFTG